MRELAINDWKRGELQLCSLVPFFCCHSALLAGVCGASSDSLHSMSSLIMRWHYLFIFRAGCNILGLPLVFLRTLVWRSFLTMPLSHINRPSSSNADHEFNSSPSLPITFNMIELNTLQIIINCVFSNITYKVSLLLSCLDASKHSTTLRRGTEQRPSRMRPAKRTRRTTLTPKMRNNPINGRGRSSTTTFVLKFGTQSSPVATSLSATIDLDAVI